MNEFNFEFQKNLLLAVSKRVMQLITVFLLALVTMAKAQTFIHPGGLHTQADLDRMKDQVAAGAHPWIDSWNALITNPKAQSTYTPKPSGNMGVSRQRASADAVAAYLNAIRGYVGNSAEHTDCAIRILNEWSATVDQVPTGTDIPGLSGIPIYQMAVAGEILRIHVPTRWATADFERFKSMMLDYFYPVCDDFLKNHNGSCTSHYWANWDICNMAAILAIGVLCDDQAKFDQAIDYFKSGGGNGSILNAIPFIHSDNLGQWQETGRDQEHALLGICMMATFCEITRNQGLDMYGYSSNRLLAAAEYSAKFNLWKNVPYTTYNNCDNVNNYWPAEFTWGGRGRLQRPIWEQLYNHYVVRMGLSAPYVQAMASVNRPEAFSHDDHFGYGTLTFTLDAAASPYPPSIPPVPTGLVATPGAGRVFLKWNPADRARGYNVLRSTTSGGPYTNIGTWTGTSPVFTDGSVTNGTTYYYVVSAINQAGTSANSAQVNARPLAAGALPSDWTRNDIVSNITAGSATYANVAGATFVVSGSGSGIGGTADGCSFTNKSVTGDATIIVRRQPPTWGGRGSQKIGIMMRESTSPNARAITVTTGDVGVREARTGVRTSTGGSMSWTRGNAYTWGHGPTWMRLQRIGNTFTASQSTDGTTWFTVVSTSISMSSSYLVGMVIGSNSTASISTHFDYVTVTNNGNVSIADGTYKIITRHSGKALEVANNGTANGSNVQQWPSNDCACQQWNLTHLGNGQYSIVGVGSGKYLDVADNSIADGANIHIWQSTGGNNQRFTFTQTSSGYYRITPVHSGKAVDVANASTADGANVQQWSYTGGDNQQWGLTLLNFSSARKAGAEKAPSAVEESEALSDAVVYPNPTTDEIIITLPSSFKEGGKTVDLLDEAGGTAMSEQFDGATHTLNVGTLSPGMYILKVVSNRKLITQKIIKK